MKNILFGIAFLTLSPIFSLAAPPSDGYKLIWSDEFDGTSLNMEKWGYQELGPRRDAINIEDCAALDGEGHLLLTTKQAKDQYHTVMISTKGKFEECFGYYECRVKLQTQLGHWSAFWLQSPIFRNGGDPKEYGTEIDIYEYLVKNKNTIHINLHWNGYGKEFHKTAGSKYEMEKAEDYHVIGLDWTPKEYVFYVDGKEAWRTDKAISQVKEFIILSLEVGDWAGDIKDAKLPDNVIFDYVRVYRKNDE